MTFGRTELTERDLRAALQQRTILVTGGAGFIGSAVCRLLWEIADCRIVNLDKLGYASSPAALTPISGGPRYAFERVDLCDRAALAELFKRHQPDAVIHLAAESHVDRSIDGPQAFIASNVVGTFNLLEACRAHPGRIAVGIDARGGMVATEGWAETSSLAAGELARRFEDAGVAAIIYTDIGRDGMLGGLNLDETLALADSISTPVIASGGVGTLADLAALKRAVGERDSVEGVIVGRALYDGRVSLPEALALLAA